jgi:SPP1 gp7 family putative phage head morphogenesis protein
VLPEVVKVEREWRAAIRAREDDVMQTMARKYLAITERLMAEFEALAEQVTRMSEAGEPVAIGKLYRLERYQRMAFHMEREWAEFRPYATKLISDEQRYLLQWGTESAVDLLQSGGYRATIEAWPNAALEAMVGQTNGGPLRALLDEATAGQGDDIGRKLVEGVGLGKNPTVIAREMADVFGMPLARAMCIARTEMLSSYRSSTLRGYRQSGLKQYQRMSAQDGRVCPGCIAAEGELFETEVDFDDHPNCRCSCLPYWPGIGGDFKFGEDWFSGQDEFTQRDILGNTRWQMWKDGDVEFKQFATRTEDPVWGGAIGATTIGDLKAGLGGFVIPTSLEVAS